LVAIPEPEREIYKPQRKIDVDQSTPSLEQQNYKFDIFLCHNSEDKEDVEAICRDLKKKRIKNKRINPWLDRSGLYVGDDITTIVKENIRLSKSIGIFIGKNGLGPYQKKELKFICEERHKGKYFTIIPVFLDDPNQIKSYVPPCFLGESDNELLYADFSKPRFKALDKIIDKIKNL
jgi:hypothetical protein